MRALALALVLVAGGAAAQATPMLPAVSEEQREAFRVCRAAVFYHLDNGATVDVVPKAFAEALQRQFSFIMHETLRNAPDGTMADAKAMIDFAENFFISFSVTLNQQRALRDDVAAREQVLIGCVPLVWAVATEHIDRLMALRAGSAR
jgi:hypothetical protein